MKCILSDIPIYKIFVDVGDFAWFIWTLFFINLIIVSLHKCFEKSEYLDLILFTSVAIIMGLTFMSPNNIMGVKNIGTELQYFVIGYLLKRHDVVEKGKKWHLIILWPMFLLLLFGWHRQHSIFFENSLNGILNEIYVMITAYIGCGAVWLLFKEFVANKTVLAEIGKDSLGIYLIHFFVLGNLMRCNLTTLLLFVIVSIISLIIVRIVRASNYLRPLIGEYITIKHDRE